MLTRIDCAHLLTADEHQPYVPAAAVLVRGDAIAWAGPGAQCPATPGTGRPMVGFFR